MVEMSTHPRVTSNEDPTVEEKSPDFDPTRTDKISEAERVNFVAARGNSSGAIEYDDRGDARWKWVTETAAATETERTFNHLKALSNDALTLEEPAAPAAAAEASRKTGYNPYDVGRPASPKDVGPAKPKPRK
jgi:hypothetical protein